MLLQIMKLEKIKLLLTEIYDEEISESICRKLPELICRYEIRARKKGFSEKDIILITYGDMVNKQNEFPLKTLREFLKKNINEIINFIHILPFFPFSSDEGFSVVDYKRVNPVLGAWSDIDAISTDFNLMVDLVANHTSIKHRWFQGFLADEKTFLDYYITLAPDTDTSAVFRPRTSSLLTTFETAEGKKYVWTTFSADQVDINYHNPDVLLSIIDILLFYVSKAAGIIRLDAIAYIWKEIGTTCIHLPEVHKIIQVMRLILEAVSPGAMIVTETNVPHRDNISYFGNGHNEAHMVYNFSLPPLTMHAFHSGNSEFFTNWAASLETPSNETTFFNFLASHDGIGITPAHGILPEKDISAMAEEVESMGGYVSYKTNSDGSESAYEFNINFFDALDDAAHRSIPIEQKVRRFITAHAVMVALQGIPGIYFHSLFGSKSWFAGSRESGMARTINRERLNVDELEKELLDAASLRHRIYHEFSQLLAVRRSNPAFHPNAPQTATLLHRSAIAIMRGQADKGRCVWCLHNISAENIHIDIKENQLAPQLDRSAAIIYQNSDHDYTLEKEKITLAPFETLWIETP